jgi:thioredoxin reductase (NADPH)
MNTVTMFGAEWCPDCQRAKSFLRESGVEFEYTDIDLDSESVKVVEGINKGKRVIPTFQINGIAYTNPDNKTLSEVLGINPAGRVVLYGADWCPDCKRAKAFLESNGIHFQWISVDEHEWAAAEVEGINAGKRIIPTLLIDDTPHTNPDNKVLTELLNLEQTKSDKVYDAIVIGAGAAGLTAALYLQREKYETLMLEKKNIGGSTFLTQKIENYPGFDTVSGPDLMDRMAKQVKAQGVDIKEGYEITDVKRDGLTFRVETPLGEFRSHAVVAAVGSTYRRLDIPGEEEFIGGGVHFCATCDGPFYKQKDVVVIGGGNSAVEEAIYLSEICNHVHIVHRKPVLSATAAAIAKLSERANITTHLDCTCVEFLGNDAGQFAGLKVKANATGVEASLAVDGAFVFIGLVPNTQFLKGTIDLDERGFVLCECGSVQTSMEGFFAAGDCRKGAIAQVAAATGEGVIASFGVKEFLRGRN